MRKLRGLLCLAMILCWTVPATAGWFGPSEEEIAACLNKYFQTTDVDIPNFLQLDLAIIECNTDAKILAKELNKLVKPKRAELDQILEQLNAKEPVVERYFKTLYAKEVHDELWQQTRELKQAAYRKNLNEYMKLYEDARGRGTMVVRAEYVAGVLEQIGKRFKEIKP